MYQGASVIMDSNKETELPIVSHASSVELFDFSMLKEAWKYNSDYLHNMVTVFCFAEACTNGLTQKWLNGCHWCKIIMRTCAQ
jgi:hypothetical protein